MGGGRWEGHPSPLNRGGGRARPSHFSPLTSHSQVPDTNTGDVTATLAELPLPSRPLNSRPQQNIAPAPVTAHMCSLTEVPRSGRIHPPVTMMGVGLSVVEPFPSCPQMLFPQQYTFPRLVAHEKRKPVLIPSNPEIPVTDTGALRAVIVPSPSCPAAFAPQHKPAPAMVTAHVYSSPEAR